jgi:signal transduction histidine kinase
VTPQALALLTLTAMVAVIVGVVTFAVLRFAAAARDTRRHLREAGGESAMLAAALQEAVGQLRAQERAMAARAAASEQLATHIVNSLTAGLLVVDRGRRVHILNPAARRMLGIQADANVSDLPALPGMAAPLIEVIDEVLATGQPVVRRALELRGRAAAPLSEGGRSRLSAQQASDAQADSASVDRTDVTYVGVTVSPLDTREGGAICLFSDLTAVVELEAQLRLKEALARLGELTAGLAHEFRNGLATIHGYSKLLDPALIPPQFRRYVDGIRQEAEALGEVVTNFLNFARPTELSLSTLDLRSVVERAADDLRPEFARSGGTLALEGEFGRVEGDDVLLRQAFINLLRNALEACQQAGIVPSVLVEGSIEAAQGAARVSVHDNGPGVAADARERLFRPFFTTKTGGTGLGLALVQKIVVTHNGRIHVTTSRKGGACFQVVLPLAAVR